MNFCVAILVLNMEENMQHFWHFVLYYFNKGKNTTETQEKICAGYAEGAVTDWTCQKWFVKFRAGDFSLDNAPWSGRQIEVDRDEIETLFENIQRYTMWETADTLKISKPMKLSAKIGQPSIISWCSEHVQSQPLDCECCKVRDCSFTSTSAAPAPALAHSGCSCISFVRQILIDSLLSVMPCSRC